MLDPLKRNAVAILVFANSSKEELRHKALVKGEILFKAFTEHTLATVKKTGLPYFHITETKQQGSHFGERFLNAISALFNEGYDRVITIGNDSPQLKAADILKANQLLCKENLVLGPSTDGGFYLMGLHKSQFNYKTFLNLPWQTQHLTTKIRALFRLGTIKIAFLRRLLDLDTPSDLRKMRSLYKSISPYIFYLILELFSFLIRWEYRPRGSLLIYHSTYFNKGSPQLPFLSL